MIIIDRNLSDILRECDRSLSAWRLITEDQLRNCRTAHGSRMERINDCIRMLYFKVQHKRTAGHDIQDYRPSCGMESLDHLPLVTFQSYIRKAMSLT